MPRQNVDDIEELREKIRDGLIPYDSKEKIQLNMTPENLEKIIFITGEYGERTFAFDFELIKKLDLTGVSFKNVMVKNTNFRDSKGVKFNPQEVFHKSLYNCVLGDAELTGPLDDAFVEKANFRGCKGAVIDPQKISGKCMRNAKLADVQIIGSFDGVDITGVDFTDAEIVESSEEIDTCTTFPKLDKKTKIKTLI